MACDVAFRIMARRYLDAVAAQHDGTCDGDVTALHDIRIALTHLRTTIRFFSPIIDDTERRRIWAGLKWLNGQLGKVRDLDVAIDTIRRAAGGDPKALSQVQSWNEKRELGHRLLARVLKSARYRNLIENTSNWIDGGPWSTSKSKEEVKARGTPIGTFATQQLAAWEKKLLKKSRKLKDMNVNERHQLRLLNKRLTYSIESLQDLFSDKRFSKQKTALKHLRKAQRCLGQLNDAARGEALAAALYGEKSDAIPHFISRKREKRLLLTAATAYDKLDKLKLFRV
ncbi:CHAD domain-containing protein [Bradyrhizobium sp.]|uniref:CHAD domain-containing protein n=1 Tax=Bradyrhizobium sp. TaxID=376 RepID=UPI0025C57C67|nr:CHAD domain-containing protein [Bradyrhizobium sp.]